MVSETRYERNAISENKQFASAYNLITGTLSSGALSDLQSSNDAYMVFNAALVGSTQRIVEVEFSGTHSGHMPFLSELIELKVSVANVALEIAAYNYLTSAYETAGSMFLGSIAPTTDTNHILSNLLNNRNYRDASGNWKVKIKTTKTDVGDPGVYTLSIDYLYFRTSYYELGTVNTGSDAPADEECRNQTLGIRVWKVNSDDTETEITAESLVATVTGPSSTTSRNNTYAPGETANCVAIIVRLYIAGIIGNTTQMEIGETPLVFMTEDLNDTLLSQTWTVYYYFLWFGAPIYETYFYFGSATRNSRINNFGHAAAAPPAGGVLAQVI